MAKRQFRVLYREFLFRIVDVELLSAHAEGDSRTLLGQFASLLIFCSVILALMAWVWFANTKNDRVPALQQMISAWGMEHFLIATTMLAVGLLAVLSWESTFPERRDVLVLGPLPIRARTLFLAKVAAVGTALGLTIAALHVLAGIAWPLALAQYNSTPAPALVFDRALPPLSAAEFPAVLNHDIQPMVSRLDLAAPAGAAGIVVGISEHGARRVMTYGAARPNSMFEIGSITKTFTGLLLAQMAVDGKLDLRDRVRDLLPPRSAPPSSGLEMTLLDLATHHSGLPFMPENAGPLGRRETYTDYRTSDLYDYIEQHGLDKPMKTDFLYSNLGFALLGAALENRAGMSYPELLRRGITGPLGMKDTVISLSPDQERRLMQAYDKRRRPTPRWDLQALAGAGGIRSTAGDMLTYLDAELHPERTPFPAALNESQQFFNYVQGDVRIGLAWVYAPELRIYLHDGGTGGFTSYAFFNRRRDYAAVILMNAAPGSFPFVGVLGEYVRQRFAGEPAFSLEPVTVPPAGPIRSLAAYWVAIIAAGTFLFCAVLGLQGVASQALPRRWYLRASAFLQMAVFCLLVTGYFLQRMPASVLVRGAEHGWLQWIPSYWFVGLYQQLSGSLHPALAPFAHRAWVALGVAICVTGAAYASSYLRTLRRIVEEPDLAPAVRSGWLPRLSGSFQSAIAQFSIRSLLRSRQHRMIFAFYLGAGIAFALLFVNAPAEISGLQEAGPWKAASIELLAASVVLTGFWVRGARVVFGLPLDLRANWIFRAAPFGAGRQCLSGWRRAIYTVSVAPAVAVSAAVLFWVWPWRVAATHVMVLALMGIILAEFSFDGVQKIPFTCSWLPGRTNLHFTFWLWLYVILAGIIAGAKGESEALGNATATGALLAGLAVVAAVCVIRNNRAAAPGEAELRFEEEPADKLVSLNLG